MAKVSGSYESVIRGVSQQVPQDRRSGQHKEQINMISDPVRGLARRHGSLRVNAMDLGGPTPDDVIASTPRHRTFTATLNGTDYDFIYRTAEVPTDSNTDDCDFNAFNKSTDQFLAVWKRYTQWGVTWRH
jgi:hypothetical protein